MLPELEQYRLLIAEVYELAGASRAGSEQMARARGLTAARWHVMSVVSEEPLSASAIARRLGLTRQSVQRVVDALAESGDVSLSADPADRRAPRVSLTATGSRTLVELFDASDRDREAALAEADLSVEALAQARTTLRGLIDALGPSPAGPNRG